MKLTVFEFLIRVIPESFILMASLFVLCNVKIRAKKYIISSVILGFVQYSVRRLPINYGVNTILGIFTMIIVMSQINKADLVVSIKSSLLITIVLFILEWLNMFLLTIFVKGGLESLFMDPFLKTLSGLPSLIGFAVITRIYYLKKGSYKCVKD